MNNKIIWIVTWVLITGLGVFAITEHYNKPKTGYMIILETYNQFELKKELEKKLTETVNKRKKVLDSLAIDLKIVSDKIDEEKGKNKAYEITYNKKRDEFYQLKQAIDEDNKKLSKQYDQEILSQLNQYVSDYGKENDYAYIFGNDGNGSLMHTDTTLNITKQIVQFINERYKGKK